MKTIIDKCVAITQSCVEKILKKNELHKKHVKKPNDDYFKEAASWADDLYISVVASRNRYRFFLYLSLVFIGLFALCIAMLIPSQHIEPLIIHQYDDGRVSVERMVSNYRPSNQAEVKADIVRYVIARESYDVIGYDHQYRLTSLLSDDAVDRQYSVIQSVTNGHSPINRLGKKYYQTVHVDNILFLDNQGLNKKRDHSHNNLAQVDFLVSTHSLLTGKTVTHPYTSLISWRYRPGSFTDPDSRWMDWNGFTVTKYELTQRSVKG